MSIYTGPTWLTTPLVVLGTPSMANMSRDEFFEFCGQNRKLHIERTAEGDLEIMTPAGADSSRRNVKLVVQVEAWNERTGLGVVFDSSGGFWLPNGAERAPDVSWVLRERWETISQDERRKFLPLAPDFVIELRSESDRLSHLRNKMQEYADNGVRLGWLIDPQQRRVEIYRPGRTPEIADNPTQLSGDPELPGFTLNLTPVW